MVSWMIYGANGYMGELIAREARARGLQPILAGRNSRAISTLGQELDCETRSFDLTNPATIVQYLTGVAAVLHCAGPFSATGQPMLDGCLRAGTQYLDINEEINVCEAIFRRRDELAQARIVAVPGVGCTVVPTDCLAVLLKRELPDANRLRLAFASRYGRTSRGTIKTVIELAAQGCKLRQDRQIIEVAPRVEQIPFEDQVRPAILVPWTDVSTAYHSTGIPTIETYLGGGAAVKQFQQAYRLRHLLRSGPVPAVLKGIVTHTSGGPTQAERDNDESLIWGEATNPAGRQVRLWLRTPQVFNLTRDAAVTAVLTLLARDLAPGAYTPSRAFGPEFVLGLQGVVGPTPA